MAKKLHRSPSAISKHISSLEQKMGVQLFQRTTRSLAITNAGQVYYERCKDIASRMDAAETELKDHACEPSGKLNITWPNVLTKTDVVSSLGDFCDQYSDIKLNVSVTPELLDLSKEGIDFAFRVTKLEDSSMVALEMGKFRPIICASPKLLEKHGMPESVKDVMSLPHVIPTYVNLAQAAKKMFPGLREFENKYHHEVDDITALHHMAKLGMGAAFIGRHVVEQDLNDGRLINLTGDKLPELTIYLVYNKQDYLPKRNRYFIDFFKARFTQST